MVLLHPGHVPVAQAVADLVNGKDAIDHSRDGAHSDERVHIGAAVEQGAEAVFVVLVVDIQDRQGEQELGKGEGYGVLVTHQESGEGGAHHVPHGDIEQGNQEEKGEDEAALHRGELRFHLGLRPLSGSPGWDPSLGGQGGAVSCLDHRLDDAFGGKGGLVVLHIHGVGHQADLRPAYALQLVHRLFHMGGACGAGHTGDVKFLFQGKHILSEEGSAHGRPSAPPPKRRKFGAEQMRYTPLGWGIFSIARGKKFVKAYHGDFLRFYAGEPLLCGKQNRGSQNSK